MPDNEPNVSRGANPSWSDYMVMCVELLSLRNVTLVGHVQLVGFTFGLSKLQARLFNTLINSRSNFTNFLKLNSISTKFFVILVFVEQGFMFFAQDISCRYRWQNFFVFAEKNVDASLVCMSNNFWRSVVMFQLFGFGGAASSQADESSSPSSSETNDSDSDTFLDVETG